MLTPKHTIGQIWPMHFKHRQFIRNKKISEQKKPYKISIECLEFDAIIYLKFT